jgi:hypothetical protein
MPHTIEELAVKFSVTVEELNEILKEQGEYNERNNFEVNKNEPKTRMMLMVRKFREENNNI